MTGETNILKIIPTLQAAGLAGENYKFVKKKKKKISDFIDVGTKNITGAALIDATADFI